LSEPADETQAASDSGALFRIFNEIGIIHQLATTAFAQVLPYALTPAQFTVLNHCVRMGDNRTPADIAAALQVTRGTLTSTLGRLTAKGFIRLIPDARDGRSKRVILTQRGRGAHQASINAATPLLARLSEGVPAGALRDLLPALEKLRTWLDANR
jgi:DNA-binding MarR family transcriptional regulator